MTVKKGFFVFFGRFQFQLNKDHRYILRPDVDRPFTSTHDALKRLSKYHIYQTKEEDKELLKKGTLVIIAWGFTQAPQLPKSGAK